MKNRKIIILLTMCLGMVLSVSGIVKADEGIAVGDFQISGGTLNTDFKYDAGVLTILSSQTLTIKNQNPTTPAGDRILVPADVEANVILAGVNISPAANSPFTLTPDVSGKGATAHIVLADNTENKLVSKDRDYPGLRCGKTTTLYIDDSVVNKDKNGKDIIPDMGKIPYDVTLLNGTRLKKGTRLTAMDSSHPGKLNTIGNDRSAGLGGGNGESAGNININGGIIDSVGCVGSSTYYGYGAGIGGGCLGDGGNIVINGGAITSLGSYHGAGIGGGCHVDATLNRLTPQVVDWKTGYGKSGNITINGGLTYSNGNIHADAFGDGCITGSTPSTSSNYKIIVTGGTIISKAVGGRNDLGGSQADVYVLGGSLKADKFSSINGQVAYGDMDKKSKVFMTKIGLDSWGLDKVNTTLVDVMNMKIDGIEYDYGTPSYTDEKGLLYLWLSDAKKGSEVSVDLDVIDKTTGDVLDTDTFFAQNIGNSGSEYLKQYVRFNVSSTDLPTSLLTKRYDGLGLDDQQIKNAVAALGIHTTLPAGGVLSDVSKMTIDSQLLKDDGVTPDENSQIISGSNVNGGKYQLIITSTEYATSTVNNFKDAYWGHRAYIKYAEITPANTEKTIEMDGLSEQPDIFRPDQTTTLKARVSPARGEGVNCASPKGKVQFYINDKKYGQPVGLTAQGKDTASGYNYSTASITFKGVEGAYCKPGEKQTISVKYVGGDANYAASEATKEYRLDSMNVDTNNDGIPDINIDTDGDKKPDINIDKDNDWNPDVNIDVDGDGIPDINIDTDLDKKPDINIDTDNDNTPDINIDTDNTGTWKPSGQGGNADKVWKPDTSMDTNGNGKGDTDYYRPVIDLDKDGVDDNWKPDKDVSKGDTIYDTGNPNINIDVNGDGIPDINIDTDNDGIPDVNIDTDGDNKPDVNIDVDGDRIPDINIDTDGDKKPDINIDTNGDGIPNINIDTDNTGIWKPSGKGGNADGIWRVDEKRIQIDEIEKPKEKTAEEKEETKVIETGDNNQIIAYTILVGVSAVGLIYIKRRKHN